MEYLKWYQTLLTIFISSISFLLLVIYGNSTIATVTERGGLNGDMYSYYDLTKVQYSLYTGFIGLSALSILGWIIANAFFRAIQKYNKVFLVVFNLDGNYSTL